MPWINLMGMLDTAFEQVRHYAVADLAVSLRLLRAMGNIAGTVQQADVRASLLIRARLVVDEATKRLGEVDAARLRQRLATLENRLAA
jgi:uncharacterized membrane protein